MARANPFLEPEEEKNPVKAREKAARNTLIEIEAFKILAALPVGSRESAIAQTKLEDAILWCKKAVLA